jgi:hypothetical protein
MGLTVDLSVNTHWSYCGLRAVVLENRLLRVVILPEAGAKIWQITFKPLDADLLWNNPRVLPQILPMGSRYDDVWSGGWDELFPNDEAAVIDGESYPDHGEIWTGKWQAEPFESADEVGVRLRYTTPISAISMDRTVRLRRDGARIDFRYDLRNDGHTPFQFLWKLHPAMRVTPQHRIDFPAMRVDLEPGFPGTLDAASQSFEWPYARVGDRRIDLRLVPSAPEQALYFLYGSQLQAGWCGLTNTATELACAILFDRQVFTSCWLFATYRGWRNYEVAVLEPCSGYPLNFEAMRAAGRHRTLAPREVLSTDVSFVVQQGLRGIAGCDTSGRLLGI